MTDNLTNKWAGVFELKPGAGPKNMPVKIKPKLNFRFKSTNLNGQ